MLTFGSLFSGCGLMDLGFERAGMPCAWKCEIDKDARRVLAHHWPGVPCHEDVHTVGKHNLAPVDVIVGGFPCQSVSVAGQRAGLEDRKKSGLFYEMARVIEELRPSWAVLENVPGLLSSNSGNDFLAILDILDSLGYIIDVDILDARFFGVAQRRRRVFLICQSRESFQRKSCTFSRLTIAQCLSEFLRLILEYQKALLPNSPIDTASLKNCVDGLQKRMRLFELPGKTCLYAGWLRNLEGDSQKSAQGQDISVYAKLEGDGNIERHRPIETATLSTISEKMNMDEPSAFMFIVLSWNDILAVICELANECITSTATSETIESRIYICARLQMRIVALIFQSNPSCPLYLSATSSALNLHKEFTSYARQASNSLFSGMEWVCAWRSFLADSESASWTRGDIAPECAAEILALAEGGAWNTAQGRKARKKVAGTIRSRFANAGVNRPGRGGEDDENLVIASTLTGGQRGGNSHGKRSGDDKQTLVVTLNSGGVAQIFETRIARNGRGQPSECAHAERGHRVGETSDCRPMLLAPGMSVRRLTPTECLRLMGAPDDFLDVEPPLSDSAKYRLCVNGCVVQVCEWIGRRMIKVIDGVVS